MIPPRTANSPLSITISERIYPMAERRASNLARSTRLPGLKILMLLRINERGGTRCKSARGVVKINRGALRLPFSSCAKVAMRSAIISARGPERSKGTQSQAEKLKTLRVGAKNSSPSFNVANL